MIAKTYNNILYTFEKRTGMSAVFSGQELNLVSEYASTGIPSDFIQRLFKLGVFHGSIKDQILDGLITKIYSPNSLHIDITTYCPLRCSSCYKIAGKNTEMGYAEWEQLITEAEQLKVFQIAIGGGEPLTHPNIVRFIQRVAQTEMSISITTSGYGLTPPLLEKLINSGINHIQISLNGSNETINRYSRDGYKQAINALLLLSQTSISYGINWVARKSNLNDFDQLVLLAKRYKANNINILRYKPSQTEIYSQESLNKEEFYQLAHKMKTTQGIALKVDSAYSNLLLYLNEGKVSKNTCGCGAGKTFMSISADGSFKPCSHLNFSEKKSSIREYWETSCHTLSMRNLKFTSETNSCYNCRFRNYCGGCRAICEKIYKDTLKGEQNCPTYEKE